MEDTFELVVIPAFGISTVGTEMEMTRRLAALDPRLSVVIITKSDVASSAAAADHPKISFLRLPELAMPAGTSSWPPQIITDHMDAYKPVVKDIILNRFSNNGPIRRRLAGFMLDLFCSPITDIATELGVPFYFMYPASCGALSFHLHFEGPLQGKLPPATTSLQVEGFRTPLPETSWPAVIRSKDTGSLFLRHIKKVRTSMGVLANSFIDLEPDVISALSLDNKVPKVYPIGPVVKMGHQDNTMKAEARPLFDWLDAQPPRSVVFLCFGTIGAFDEDQVREIAGGLERSGHRFVWSLVRKSDDYNEVLPEGFLERTVGQGRVVGWAPQAEVLAHAATGALVSHCSWDSLMESMWCGVPAAVWPLLADQHLYAHYWVNEAGLGTEMCMDDSTYVDNPAQGKHMHFDAERVEKGIRRVMEGEERVAFDKRLAEMSRVSKNALLPGGSANYSFTLFVDDVIRNVSSSP